MATYSRFSHEKWWFSIAMLVHQRVNHVFNPCRTKNGARLALFRNNHCFCILQLLEGCAIFNKKTDDELDEKGNMFFGWKNTHFLGGKIMFWLEKHMFLGGKNTFLGGKISWLMWKISCFCWVEKHIILGMNMCIAGKFSWLMGKIPILCEKI